MQQVQKNKNLKITITDLKAFHISTTMTKEAHKM